MSNDKPGSPLWRLRDFRLLMIGNVLNGIGSRMTGLTLPLLALWLTDKPILAGAVGASVLGGLVIGGVPAGALVDRCDRRTLLMGSALSAAAAYATVVLAYATSTLHVAHLVGAGLAVGAAEAVFGPADTSATRSVVPDSELAAAMSAVQGRQGVTNLVGGPVGGVLFAVSRSLPIVADVLSYLAAAGCAALIRTPLPASEGEQHEPMFSVVRAGWRFVWRHHVLRPVVVVASLLNFAVNGFLLVLIVVLHDRAVSTGVIGLTESAMALTMIAGSLFAAALLSRVRTGLVLVAGTALLGCGLMSVAAVHSIAAVLLLLAASTLLLPAVNAGMLTYVMRITPDGMQGRVQSALMTTVMATSPLAPTVGGLLVARFGGQTALLCMGGCALACGLLIGTVRSLRTMPRLDSVPT